MIPPFATSFTAATFASTVLQAGWECTLKNLWATLVVNWYMWPGANYKEMQNRPPELTPTSRRYSYPRTAVKESNKLSTSSSYTSAHRSLPLVTLNEVDSSEDSRAANQISKRETSSKGKSRKSLGISTHAEDDNSSQKAKMNSPSAWLCDLSNGMENLFFSKDPNSCLSDNDANMNGKSRNASNAAQWREKSTKQILSDSDEEAADISTSNTDKALHDNTLHVRHISSSHNKSRISSNSNNFNISTTEMVASNSHAALGRFTPVTRRDRDSAAMKGNGAVVPTDVDVSNATTVSVSSVLTVNSVGSGANSLQRPHSRTYLQAQSSLSQSGPGTGASGGTEVSNNTNTEARIVAPNVSKLSPHSAVEVRLQSTTECVAVLCSVDVLKMRSGYFHDVLSEQEKEKSRQSKPSSSAIIWREPITVFESLPYEAAAYLESLHEGRALFRGEWNFCWARLSVSWIIDDMILEYAAQIEAHMNKIIHCIQSNHWRSSPNILNGMRVAVFRKSSSVIPAIITGVAIEANTSIGYSKLRVAFDSDKVSKIGANSLLNIHAVQNGSGPNILSQIYSREAAYTSSINGSHSQSSTSSLSDQPAPIAQQQQQQQQQQQ
eukprot:gene28385-37467_t